MKITIGDDESKMVQIHLKSPNNKPFADWVKDDVEIWVDKRIPQDELIESLRGAFASLLETRPCAECGKEIVDRFEYRSYEGESDMNQYHKECVDQLECPK